MYRRLVSDDASLKMPPPDSKLTADQRSGGDLCGCGLSKGRNMKNIGRFITPARPALPTVSTGRLAAKRHRPLRVGETGRNGTLTPAPRAAKETLIRRLSLDLTGLPPTLDEIDAFLADASPDAYEKLVDRLLASPAYGERMAMQWLDEARYADTNGYQNDAERYMWRWRDWVIDAFNANMPFDQFTIEQLAGDLLPNRDARPTDRHGL